MLDILFAGADEASSPYYTKVTLRYGDTDTQLDVLTYPSYPKRPGGQAEIIKLSINGMESGKLRQFIEEQPARNPEATPRDIAAMLKVDVTHLQVDEAALGLRVSASPNFSNQILAITICPPNACRSATSRKPRAASRTRP